MHDTLQSLVLCDDNRRKYNTANEAFHSALLLFVACYFQFLAAFEFNFHFILISTTKTEQTKAISFNFSRFFQSIETFMNFVLIDTC